MEPDRRDEVVDFVREWSEKTETAALRLVGWLQISRSKFQERTWRSSWSGRGRSFPDARRRVISDNGPQHIARDFQEFMRLSGMTHVRTSPFYPQSNGKQERWHGTLKRECIRVQTPLSLEDARRIVENFVERYNTVRLHSAIGYVTPQDKLEGRARGEASSRAGTPRHDAEEFFGQPLDRKEAGEQTTSGRRNGSGPRWRTPRQG